ncbi:MAG: flagellar hook-associated protein FlgL [Gammaproteobacteria bacterium]|nr:flagellar hook-associated protein FlgL [Gammaproteobacteria bacterium]
MRISNQLQYQQSLSKMLDIQAQTAKYQNQISSGKRIANPSEDPSGSTKALQLTERIEGLSQYARNASYVELRLQHQEGVISSIEDVMQRVRELTLQGKNGALSTSDRRAIAAEIRQHRETLVGLGNTQNESGEYIFSGMAVDTQPFSNSPAGNVVYSGDQTTREIEVGEFRKLRDGFSGYEVFMAIREGNGSFAVDLNPANTGSARVVSRMMTDPANFAAENYRIQFTSATTYDLYNDTTGTLVAAAQVYSEDADIAFNGLQVALQGTPAAGDEVTISPARNVPVFDMLDGVISALESDPISSADWAKFHQSTDNFLGDIDQAQENILQVRTAIGARLNGLQIQHDVNETLDIQLKRARSDIEDVDIAEAVSALVQQTTVLEAAQAAFVRVQGMNLFDLL